MRETLESNLVQGVRKRQDPEDMGKVGSRGCLPISITEGSAFLPSPFTPFTQIHGEELYTVGWGYPKQEEREKAVILGEQTM